MNRLYIITASVLALLLLIPFASSMAVSPASSCYTHFIYMFAHANIIHWLLNAFSLIVLNRVVNVHRCIAAYLASVIISFLPYIQPSHPVVGMSGIIFFFTGFITSCLLRYYRNRHLRMSSSYKTMIFQIALVLALGFVIPNMAASYHLLAFVSGCLYSYAERELRYLSSFLNTNSH